MLNAYGTIKHSSARTDDEPLHFKTEAEQLSFVTKNLTHCDK